MIPRSGNKAAHLAKSRASASHARRNVTGYSNIFDVLCTEKRGIDRRTLETVILLAVEISREGREGHKIGTLFVVGDVEQVLKRSKELILDPLKGQALFPFVHKKRLAWLLFDLFETEPLRYWRYQDDPEDVRRPVAVSEEDTSERMA